MQHSRACLLLGVAWCVGGMQVESYIREVLGMPPRELEPAAVRGGAVAGGAAAAAPSASDGPASGRQPSGVRAVQVRRAAAAQASHLHGGGGAWWSRSFAVRVECMLGLSGLSTVMPHWDQAHSWV